MDIEGLSIRLLPQFPDDRGKVMHMLRCDSPEYKKFGEVYMSWINPSVIKGWKRHRIMEQHLTVPVGEVKFVISNNGTKYYEFILDGKDKHALLTIPPNVWYAFQCLSSMPAMIVNCADYPFTEGESEIEPINNSVLQYEWSDNG